MHLQVVWDICSSLWCNTLVLHDLEIDHLADFIAKHCTIASAIPRGQNHMRWAFWARCNGNGKHEEIDRWRTGLGQEIRLWSRSKEIFPSRVTKKCVDTELDHTPLGLDRSGHHGPKNAARITLTRWRMERFMSKPPKGNQSLLCDEEWLVSGQTSKGIIEALALEGPRQGKDIAREGPHQGKDIARLP